MLVIFCLEEATIVANSPGALHLFSEPNFIPLIPLGSIVELLLRLVWYFIILL